MTLTFRKPQFDPLPLLRELSADPWDIALFGADGEWHAEARLHDMFGRVQIGHGRADSPYGALIAARESCKAQEAVAPLPIDSGRLVGFAKPTKAGEDLLRSIGLMGGES